MCFQHYMTKPKTHIACFQCSSREIVIVDWSDEQLQTQVVIISEFRDIDKHYHIYKVVDTRSADVLFLTTVLFWY